MIGLKFESPEEPCKRVREMAKRELSVGTAGLD
jgi:hypothetical protein